MLSPRTRPTASLSSLGTGSMDDRIDSHANRLRQARLSAYYAAGVIGLAVFLLAAVLYPAPIEAYLTRAVVEQLVDDAQHEATTDLPLLTQSQAEAIARDAFANAPDDASLATPPFAAAVDCQVDRLNPYRVRLVIETRDRVADRSLGLCDR